MVMPIIGAQSPRPDTNGAGKSRPYKGPILGNIVAYFKYQTTKRINERRKTPGESVWQRNYYDHIIRNERSLYKIREYIRSNPERLTRDKENSSFQDTDEFDRWLKEEGKRKIKTKRIS